MVIERSEKCDIHGIYGYSGAGDPPITLTYVDGRFAGRAGCNRYVASVEAGQRPGEIQVGMAGSTRMICPEASMAVERRFFKQLQGVNKMAFLAGQLALTHEVDGRWASMRFERVPHTQ